MNRNEQTKNSRKKQKEFIELRKEMKEKTKLSQILIISYKMQTQIKIQCELLKGDKKTIKIILKWGKKQSSEKSSGNAKQAE